MKNYFQQQGAVVFFALVFLLILTLASLDLLSMSQLESKMNQHFYEQMQTFQLAEWGLNEAERNLVASKCYLTSDSARLINYQKLNWSLHPTCELLKNNEFEVRYLIAPQFYHVCVLNKDDSENLQKPALFYSDFFKVTVRASMIHSPVNTILQTHWVKLNFNEPCQQAIISLKPGRQSWVQMN